VKTLSLSPRTRVLLAALSAFWVLVAAVRLVAWSQGHPGEPASLVLSLVAGTAGLAGLVAFAAGRRKRS
jgi:hypothetical protein